jgi:hypothetical protein
MVSTNPTVPEDTHMKRTAFRRRPVKPITHLAAENALLRAYDEDTCDDRVTEDIYDIEEEYAEVAIVRSRSRMHAVH